MARHSTQALYDAALEITDTLRDLVMNGHGQLLEPKSSCEMFSDHLFIAKDILKGLKAENECPCPWHKKS